MPRYPDEDLPQLQVSLEEWVNIARRILTEEGPHTFVRFALGGRVTNHAGVLHRVYVNACNDAQDLEAGAYSLSRDVDAAVGLCATLPFSEPLAVFPLPSFTDTLKKDNHIMGHAFDREVRLVDFKPVCRH